MEKNFAPPFPAPPPLSLRPRHCIVYVKKLYSLCQECIRKYQGQHCINYQHCAKQFGYLKRKVTCNSINFLINLSLFLHSDFPLRNRLFNLFLHVIAGSVICKKYETFLHNMCNFLLKTSDDNVLLTVGKLLKETTSFQFSTANSGHVFFSICLNVFLRLFHASHHINIYSK